MCVRVMQAMIQEVVGQPEGAPPDSGPLQMMTKDQYANYVVQKMLEVSRMPCQELCYMPFQGLLLHALSRALLHALTRALPQISHKGLCCRLLTRALPTALGRPLLCLPCPTVVSNWLR